MPTSTVVEDFGVIKDCLSRLGLVREATVFWEGLPFQGCKELSFFALSWQLPLRLML